MSLYGNSVRVKQHKCMGISHPCATPGYREVHEMGRCPYSRTTLKNTGTTAMKETSFNVIDLTIELFTILKLEVWANLLHI